MGFTRWDQFILIIWQTHLTVTYYKRIFKNYIYYLFQWTGGRGYLQEVWVNYRNYDLKLLREKFNATYPVKSSLTVEYGAQDFSNLKRYQRKQKDASARFVWISLFLWLPGNRIMEKLYRKALEKSRCSINKSSLKFDPPWMFQSIL